MWVKGDLKDQLGLQRRKARKRKDDHHLETAPMFRDDHIRSLSEVSSHHDYQPANTNSPGIGTPIEMDTPPIGASTVDLPHAEGIPQYPSLSPIPGKSSPVSPHPSYYSASDIPPPSPLPSPMYRYPDGEITNIPPPKRASVSTTRSSTVVGAQLSPFPPQSSQTRSSAFTLNVSTPALKTLEEDPGVYEMHVRSSGIDTLSVQHHQLPPRSTSEASNISYATAPDNFWVEDDAAHAGSQGHMPQPGLLPNQQHFNSLDDEDDRATIVGDHNQRHDRQVSEVSWEGGRAL